MVERRERRLKVAVRRTGLAMMLEDEAPWPVLGTKVGALGRALPVPNWRAKSSTSFSGSN